MASRSMTVLPGTTSARQLIVDRSQAVLAEGPPGLRNQNPCPDWHPISAAHPVTHGVFAVATVVLVLLAALNVGGS
jgi:hypothetical protein